MLWEDGRRGSGAIFSQHLNSNGQLTLSENGMEIYYGVDGKSDNIKSERINETDILLYWEDRENGVNSTYNFGKIISNDYGYTYQNAISVPNASLSDNLTQLNAEVKKIGNNLFMGFLQDNFQEFGVDPFEGYSQYFQILNFSSLDLVGDANGTWLNPTDFFQYDFISEFGRDLDLLVNDDNTLFYFTSLSEFSLALISMLEKLVLMVKSCRTHQRI